MDLPNSRIQPLLEEAIANHRRGDVAQARSGYLEILGLEPSHAQALHLLGVTAIQAKQFGSAVELIDKALEVKPDYAEAWSNRGLALQALGQLQDAVDSFKQALAIRNDTAETWFNLGNALQQTGDHNSAIESYNTAISLRPKFIQAIINRGNVQKLLGRFHDAVTDYDRVIAIRPNYAEAWSNRGVALQRMGQIEQALESFGQAVAVRPEYAEAWYNRGRALHDLHRLEAAVQSYDQAITIRPDYPDAVFNKAITLLLNGKFEEGWPLYEWRWKVTRHQPAIRRFRQKLWLGSEPIAGKTILLHAEQGLGDAIQFCRYAPLVAAMGARVVLEVPQSLTGLCRQLAGVDEVVATGDPLPGFDLFCPLLSLPLAFGTTVDTIPVMWRYFRSSSELLKKWELRIGEKQKRMRIGIVWSGNTTPDHLPDRSIRIEELLEHLPETFEYVSLQKEIRPDDMQTFQSQQLIAHYGDELKDFRDTLAIAELMDMVISIDTSVAHLCAASGIPTWILLHYNPDWRWLLDREKSPWYPAATLFRQHKPGIWKSVLEEVTQRLEL